MSSAQFTPTNHSKSFDVQAQRKGILYIYLKKVSNLGVACVNKKTTG